MNTTISRILVPLDFSPHSQRALEYATALAARLGAALHLLSVVEPMAAASGLAGEMYFPSLAELTDKMVEEARRYMAESKAYVPPGLVVTSDVAIGTPATTITDVAQEQKCDLIVMGTHGRTGLAHLFMGSVAERVTRLAPCPVLTVRPVSWATSAPAPARATARRRARLER